MTATASLDFGHVGLGSSAPPLAFVQGSARHNLRQLVVMRNIAITAQTVTVLVAHKALGMALPLWAMGLTILALLLFNVMTWRRLASADPVTDRELLFQLLVDVAALSVLLAMAGGGTNPFIGMLLLPLAITAACLPWSYTWIVAMVTVASYSLLVLFFHPLFEAGEEARYLQLLVAGMWVNYAVTAGMVAHFVARIALALRRSEHAFASRRESELCSEHLARVGVLAAGAAHELAQPLSTVAVVVREMERHDGIDPELREQLRQVATQIRHCQDTLGELLSYGRNSFDARGGSHGVALDDFVRDVLDAFAARRPGVRVNLSVETPGAAPSVPQDLALRQGLLNLLGNAADASPGAVQVRVRWSAEAMSIAVRDRGPGFPPQLIERAGKLFLTTKAQGAGNGLGLALARTAVSRLGGSLELRNEPQGGACAEIVLPTLQGVWDEPLRGATA
jgi:two-component system sensor histidine kinase RegB